MSIESPRFSRVEVRTMNRISKDPVAHRAFARSIQELRGTLLNAPDSTWADFDSFHPEILQTQGAILLEGAFVHYQSAHRAALYWKSRYEEDGEETRNAIRNRLGIPDDLPITEIRFLPDCGALLMPSEALNKLNAYLDEKSGVTASNGEIEGFKSDYFFLEDSEGNYCDVVVISDKSEYWSGIVLSHEREHIVFDRYYLRNKLRESIPEDSEKVRTTFKKFIHEEISQETTPEGATNKLKEAIDDELSWYSVKFFNELIAYGAGGSYKRRARTPLGIAHEFMPYGERTKVNRHSSAEEIRQIVDGAIDAVRDSHFSSTEKIKMWQEIERRVATFCGQNELIAEWIRLLWIETNYDINRFVSVLESIPLGRISSIGHFINRDPAELRRELVLTEGKEADRLWPMLVRFTEDQRNDLGPESLEIRPETRELDEEFLHSVQLSGFIRELHKAGIELSEDAFYYLARGLKGSDPEIF